MDRSLGAVLITVGIVVVVVGVLVWSGALSWFGRLPGDLRIQGERTRVHVPLVSMILLSVVLTIVVNVIARWRS
jgi:uncharacterized membrane protein YidH (DUF202 family)